MDLPIEIVRMILQHLFNSNPPSFLNCTRVSKSWHDLATPILWKDVSMDCRISTRLRASQLNRMLEAGHNSLTNVQSLTFCHSETYKSYMRLDLLLESSKLWSKLPLLSSLSCNLGTWQQHSETDDQDPRDTTAFIRIIEMVPATVRHLELINVDVRDEITQGHGHLCDTIARLLPQLRRLRIENSLICPAMFNTHTACPGLAEIIINNSSWYFFEDCATGEPYQFRQPERRERAMNEMTKAALRAMKYMPEIQRCIVYTDGPCRDDRPRGSREFFCNTELDLIENKTTIYPYRGVTMDLLGEVDVVKNPILKWIRYRDVYTQVETDLVSDVNPRKALVIEQPLSWLESSNGARLPRQLAKQREYETRVEVNRRAMEAKALEFFEKNPTKLKYWEERIERSLLPVETLQGLVVNPAWPQREHPKEELELDPESATATAVGKLWFK